MLICECVSDGGVAGIDWGFSARSNVHRLGHTSNFQPHIKFGRRVHLGLHVRRNRLLEPLSFRLNRVGSRRNEAKTITTICISDGGAAETLFNIRQCDGCTGDHVTLWIGHGTSYCRRAALPKGA